MRGEERTNEQHQTFGGRFLHVDAMLAHAMDDWAYKVD
jgi:hypothetical protein